MDSEKFCFCKLRNGAYLWGVLSTMISAILLIMTISTDIFMETENIPITSDYNHQRGYEIRHETYRTPCFWIAMICSTIHLIASIFLVIGSLKRNALMMLTWIVVNGITFIPLAVVAFFALLFAIPIFGPLYIWWFIYSDYQKIQQNSPPISNNSVAFNPYPSAPPLVYNHPLDVNLKHLDEAKFCQKN